jgi:ADP-ribose pyrophosphatase YjhB (NUDIX family)
LLGYSSRTAVRTTRPSSRKAWYTRARRLYEPNPRDGNILLGLRHGSRGAGTWSPPGGHLDFGQDPLDSTRRGAWKETGVEFGACEFACLTNDVLKAEHRHYLTLFSRAEVRRGEPVVRLARSQALG